MSDRRYTLAAMLAVAMWTGGEALGGATFFAGRYEDGQFVAAPSVSGPCYTVRYSTITAAVGDGGAETTIRETVLGPREGVTRTLCLIPLPAGVEPASVHVAAGAPEAEPNALPAKVLGVNEARRLHEAVAKATGMVTVVSLSGRPAAIVEDFPLASKTEITVTYRQKPRRDAGVCFYDCPMPSTAWARGPVARLGLTATVTSGKALRSMFSPSHNARIERDGLHKAVVRVKADQWAGRDDFRLCYVAADGDLGLRLLAHRPDANDNGYFLLMGNPTGSVEQRPALPKDVLFVLDTSGSMRGEKVEQARAAVEYCLDHLHAGDRFNIITFGTEVASFRPKAVDRAPAHVAAARAFVDAAVARGRTNISGALARGLAGEADDGRLRIMIFLTDGTPTAGEIVPEKIVAAACEQNAAGTRVFVMGVGHDVNAHLLDQLAERTDGSSEYVGPDEEIDVKIAALYDRLSHPVLDDVKLAFGTLRPTAVFPAKLPALFLGTEIMVAGRYRTGGKHTMTVSGSLAGKPVQYTCTAVLPDRTSGEANEFVAPLWAARKIGFLLREIRLHGENKELIEEIVRLSTKFGIVTEYTEFLASGAPAGAITGKAAYAEAVDRLRAARGQQTGQWAVNQAMNELDLQNRVVATGEANLYRDRRGRVVANDNIRQVGRMTFYNRDGQWVTAEAGGDRKARRVKLFSKEYFALLRDNKDFARAQRLGWNVEMNIGDERIVVEKDGKVRDEKLRNRAKQNPQPRQQQIDQRNLQLNQFRQQQIDPRLREELQKIQDERDRRGRPNAQQK